jgi:hypothetical protein
MCFKHYVWEKVRRAEIDLERVRQWLKMDELLEQERQVRASLVSRAGVLGLMLHSTYNHDIMEKLCTTQQQQAAAAQQRQQQQQQQLLQQQQAAAAQQQQQAAAAQQQQMMLQQQMYQRQLQKQSYHQSRPNY